MFNPSSLRAPVVGSDIKSKICKSAKVYINQSGVIDENSVVDIMKFSEYSLPILKGRISQLDIYRPL